MKMTVISMFWVVFQLTTMIAKAEIITTDTSHVECGTDEILNGNKEQPQDLSRPIIRRAASVDEDKTRMRVSNCAAISGSSKKTKSGVMWNLVSRKRDKKTTKIYEVWRDSKSGLLWGDKLDKTYTNSEASTIACNGNDGRLARAGLTDKTFTLPSIEDFQLAERHGIREVLPNMNEWFWSSAFYPKGLSGVRIFDGSSGRSSDFDRSYHGAIRCVAR